MAMTRKTAAKRLAAVGYLIGHKHKGEPVWAQYEYFGKPGHERIHGETLEDLVATAEANPKPTAWWPDWSRT
jgi:hypothetical protein